MKIPLLLTLTGLALSFTGPVSMAQNAMKVVMADEIVWTDDTLNKGLQFVNLIGDPSKAELVVSRVKLPPNFKIPLHTHPWSEVITVLSGALGNASSDTDKGEVLKAGSVLAMPANHPHRVWSTDQETIFQFSYMGPFDMTFVNPADDPRKKAE
jgi:quercetin dioxygenase-like cupin family protein